MSNDDPFTLDLFGRTAPSSGLGLGITAFGSDFGADHPEEEQLSSPTAPVPDAKPVTPVAYGHRRVTTATPRGQNFVLDSNRGLAKLEAACPRQ